MSINGDHRNWTRREMLAAGGGLVGAAIAGGATRAIGRPFDQTEGDYGPFKMGLQSYSLRGVTRGRSPDLQMALNATRELGIHYWESYPAHVPMATGPQEIAQSRRLLASANVSLVGYGVVHLGKDEAANRKYFEFARTMGVKYLSASPDPDAFDILDKLVEEYGIAVGIHNHGPGDRYEKIATIEKAIKDHHPKIGCCVDTGHFLRSREDPVHAVEVFGQRVYGVHLKDVKDAREFTILGRGDLRTVDLLKALAKNHYDYCLAIEYEENPDRPVDDIKACLAEARRAIAEVKKG